MVHLGLTSSAGELDELEIPGEETWTAMLGTHQKELRNVVDFTDFFKKTRLAISCQKTSFFSTYFRMFDQHNHVVEIMTNQAENPGWKNLQMQYRVRVDRVQVNVCSVLKARSNVRLVRDGKSRASAHGSYPAWYYHGFADMEVAH